MQKLNNNPITIHEFSTGVVLNSTETGGGIVSRTKNWLNVSFPDGEIPYSIERAIANQFFAASGTQTEPTIIGRFIPGVDGNWSVVAINNLVETIDGELIPVSRYFVSEGDTLEHLVNWIEIHYQLFDTYPTFDPHQLIPENANNLFSCEQETIVITEQLKQKLNQYAKNKSPLILTKKLPLLAVYQQSRYLAKLAISPVAFAYQATNLKKVRSFQVIHTHYEQEIREGISSEHIAINPDVIVFDGQRIKSLIKSLIAQEAFSLTALSGFMREVVKNELPTPYWHKIFDDLGAKIALTKEIAPPLMIKLLTLRCLTLPETELELMAWIGQNSSPIITEVYNDFRGKLLRNISDWYSDRFDLFSLDNNGKPIPKTFCNESYQVFINEKLILEKQGETVIIRPTMEELEILQNAINSPKLVKEEVKIINNNKVVFCLKNGEVCVNIIDK